MALSITVNGAGTFTASMEEGPVSFTASLAAVGPQGPAGATGPAGVVAASAPITYNAGTQTVGISATPTFTSVTATTGNLTTVNLTTATFADATSQTTAFVGESRKEYIIARNNTGSTIAKGKVVYLSGATGNKPTMALAQADAEATSARTIGILVEETANNADGKVIVSGAAENIDTSAFNDGDTLYLSATTAGAMTTTLPTQPLHGVVIGIVTRANPSVGSVEVAINNYQELEELSDVLISGEANNDLLAWDSTASVWKNRTFSALGLLTSSTAASTYAPIASPTFTGTVTIPAGASISGYLTTASAASTYAPLASPTFTGTVQAPTPLSIAGGDIVATCGWVKDLGYITSSALTPYLTSATAASTYQTISGMSSYAPLVSPTFTGTPTAPTAAASTNTTQIATTAFVQQEVPAASTTTAGKVELADDSEARAATATNRAVTPSSFPWLSVRPGFRSLAAVNSTSVSGSGSATANSGLSYSREVILTSLATGRAAFRFGISALVSSGIMPSRGYLNRIDFSKKIWLAGTTCMNLGTVSATDYSGDANTISRVCFGRPGEASTADMTGKGIGIKKVGGASSYVTLTVHDGTNLTDVATTYQNASQENFEWVVYSDGSGNVTLWINGSQAATTSAGPTGLGDANYSAYIEQVYAASTPTVRQGMQSTGGWLYIE